MKFFYCFFLLLCLHPTKEEERVLTVLDHIRVPKTLVLTFDHSKQGAGAGDHQVRGHEGAAVYYHIKTPLKKADYVMYRYDLTGYAYGLGKPLDIIWVGYNYRP